MGIVLSQCTCKKHWNKVKESVCQSMFLSARTHQEQGHSVSKQFEHSYILWWKHLCVAHNMKLWNSAQLAEVKWSSCNEKNASFLLSVYGGGWLYHAICIVPCDLHKVHATLSGNLQRVVFWVSLHIFFSIWQGYHQSATATYKNCKVPDKLSCLKFSEI
jgi:hypothetical protein